MRKLYADLIQETTTTAGTGAVALTAVNGWVRFSSRFSVSDRVYYMIENGINKEVGLGTYSASNQLTRTTILGTLNAGAWTTGGSALTLSGTSIVRSVAPEALLASFPRAELVHIVVNTTCEDGKSYVVEANGLTLTLPAVPQVNDRIEVMQGELAVTSTVIDPDGEKINGELGTMAVDVNNFSFWLVYVSAAYGWKVQQ